VGVNLWFEHIVDAYLKACAEGRDWREACAAAERNIGDKPRRVLTQKVLSEKGIGYTRQHLVRRVADGNFPAPFQLPDFSEEYTATRKAKQRKATAASGNQIVEG
jgi:hypothetical protein